MAPGRAAGAQRVSELFDRFAIPTIINAYGTNTRLSAGPLADAVADAMRAAATASVDILDLQAAACREITRATGAEAGFVTAGASAGLLLAAAACLARLDAGAMNRLPATREGRCEFLIARSQRNMYDRAIETAGGRLVDVGIPDRVSGAGVRDASAAEYLDAVTPRTAGILYVANDGAEPPLPALARAAREVGLPVIVDAAAQLPPVGNLRRFLAEGADLVVYSGGKAIGGPQASGILCGRADLVASALAQMLDLDLPEAQFRPPPEFAPLAQMAFLPRTGIGRSCKVGREEVMGLLVALRRFTEEAPAARTAGWRARLDALRAACPLPFEEAMAGEVPLLLLRHPHAAAIEARLREGRPAVHVNTARLREGLLTINPLSLHPRDIPTLAARLLAAWSD
jgi:L-seryl-tRNA(Ser) seleniumtransferase